MNNFKRDIPDKVAEWVLVRTKGPLAFASTFLAKIIIKIILIHISMLKYWTQMSFLRFEACLKDPKLKAHRYNAVKRIEHAMWMRRA